MDRRLTGEKEIHIFVRSDKYYLEPIKEGEGCLVLDEDKICWQD
ncbi:MAG: hypothetical protein ACO2O0_03150 [Desulfurococcales archaeon]